jgi:hypothetical protein
MQQAYTCVRQTAASILDAWCVVQGGGADTRVICVMMHKEGGGISEHKVVASILDPKLVASELEVRTVRRVRIHT